MQRKEYNDRKCCLNIFLRDQMNTGQATQTDWIWFFTKNMLEDKCVLAKTVQEN